MNVYIADSQIHGKGVHAFEPIEAGHWQWVYGVVKPFKTPRKVCSKKDECCKHERVEGHHEPWMDYCFEWDDSNIFLPHMPWRFLNHSTNPNCEVGEHDSGNIIMVVEALRDIEPNEELTIDYGYDPSKD